MTFHLGTPSQTLWITYKRTSRNSDLRAETRDLQGFYDSVRSRASGVKTSEGRQAVLSDLYEQFFKKALKKEAERLGIAYTPIPLVDFVLHSVNDVLQEEFGKTISDENVHVFDPFTGTGTFIVQILQSGLIQSEDLERKYREELHANEILLLAYYIASVNIEEAFRGQRGEDKGYEPFEGIILTDTFNLNNKEEAQQELDLQEWLPDNNERAERQQELDIEVIVVIRRGRLDSGVSADDNPNVDYPELEKRVRDTYAERSTATLKNSPTDTYKMAIRWATDRIGEKGIIAFVTNGSWIDGNVDSGIRACLVKEFSSVHVLHLRGNARTSGERRRAESGNVFGGSSRAPVTLSILIKKPEATAEECKIPLPRYWRLSPREEKLKTLSQAVSIKGFNDWQAITPNKHYDWVDQRSDAFAEFYPIGTKEAKSGRAGDAIFKLFSSGYKTSRDAYIYNFSRNACAENALRMTQDYLAALSEMEANSGLTKNVAARRHTSNIGGTGNLKTISDVGEDPILM